MTRDSDGGGGTGGTDLPKDRIPGISGSFTIFGHKITEPGKVAAEDWLDAYREAEAEWQQELDERKRVFVERAQAAANGEEMSDPRGWRKWFDNGPMASDEHPTAKPIPLQGHAPSEIQSLAANVWARLAKDKGLPDALMRPVGDLTEKVLGGYVQGKYAMGVELDNILWGAVRPYLEKHGKAIQEKANQLADAQGVKRPFPFVLENEEFAHWWVSNALAGKSGVSSDLGGAYPFPGSRDPDPWNRGARDMFDTLDPNWEEKQLPGRGLDREFRHEQQTLKDRAAGTYVPPGGRSVPYEHAYDQWKEQNARDQAEYLADRKAQTDPAEQQRRRNFTE